MISTYVPCPDIRIKVTPDLKSPALGQRGSLLWVTLSDESRLSGTAFAQCFSQLGDSVPDLEKPSKLKDGFEITQKLLAGNIPYHGIRHPISEKIVISTYISYIERTVFVPDKRILAGHDISDGGLVTCVLEMAFGGLSGLEVNLPLSDDPLSSLFAEEVGWVVEVAESNLNEVKNAYTKASIKCHPIGYSTGYGLDSIVSCFKNLENKFFFFFSR